MYKILMIEDDETIANVIKKLLIQWEYEVEIVEDFQKVLEKFLQFEPHLVLMDISLPFFNGYHWCNEIRRTSKVPIIFISSISDSMNIVMAMNMGGDDFIVKPFEFNILIAKIQAVMRRTYAFAGQVHTISHQDVLLNLNDATLHYGGKKIELTKNEFKIMQVLLENKGKVVSRDELMIRLWESDSFIDDNTLTVNVTRLRKRLEKELNLKQWIQTKKGMGYMVRS